MFTISEFERINTEFNQELSKRKEKLTKIWGIALLLTVIIIIGFIIAFPNQFKNPGVSWILPTYGGMLFATVLTGFLITLGYRSEKPFFNVLFEAIYQKINMSEGMFLNYKAYDNEDKSFNKRGGLFTSYATVRIKRHIIGDSDGHNHFNIYDTTMTTSSGKNQTTHFNGVYITLDKQFNTCIQIRTNGSPKLKGVSFDKNKEIEGIKVYKESGKELTNIDLQLIQFATKLSQNQLYKKVYLGVVDGQIHLALWYRKHPARKQKSITVETMNKLYTYFLSEYTLINNLANIEAY